MIRLAQLLLVISAAAVWGASRLDWVEVGTFDGLGQPRTSAVDGATWSGALVPLAVLLLAAALAGLAARGWLLRAVALLVASACLVLGYLGLSLIVMTDVGPRGAALAGVPVVHLVSSERHLTGAVITLGASVCALGAAALLMRGAATARAAVRYDRAGTADGPDAAEFGAETSERSMWEALDAGRDPTTEGR